MFRETHLDEIVEYPQKVIQKLVSQQELIDLLAGKVNASIEDLEDSNGSWKCLYDYEFIPATQQETICAICVDVDLDRTGGTAKTLDLYISVLVSKNLMDLDTSIFVGCVGNRMSNLVRYIDLAIRGSKDFGIGTPDLTQVKTVPSGNNEVCKKTLLYRINDFAVNRSVLV